MNKTLNFFKTASSGLQFKINTSIIFNYIRENGPISRIRISKELNFSPSAVSRVINVLIKKGYIVETEKLKTKCGKRPTLLAIREDRGYVIGIELGKEKLKLAFTNFNGDIMLKHSGFKISNDEGIDIAIIDEIEKAIDQHSNKKIINKKNLKGICIGIPATVNIDTGIIFSTLLYSNWKNKNFKKIFKDTFNVPVFVENGANLSALGEKHFGQGKNFKNFIFVEISNGIGAGIIIDNQLFRGSFGSAGEIGFKIFEENNIGFKILNKGYLEKHASVESIKKIAIKEIVSGKKTILNEMAGDINEIEPFLVCEAAIRGDRLANSIIKRIVNYLSILLIDLILIINPEAVILGGDICNLPGVKTLFLEPITHNVNISIPFETPVINLSLLGEDTGIMGASFLATETLIINDFPYKIESGILSRSNEK